MPGGFHRCRRVLHAGWTAAALLLLTCCAPPRENVSPNQEKVNTAGATRLAEGLYVLSGAVNTGVLVHGDRALLFDCDDSVTPERLSQLGVNGVDAVYFTQFRRPNTAGGPALAEKGAALFGPAAERASFERAWEYWDDWFNRWHAYHSRPGMLVPAQSRPLTGVVRGGEGFDWNGYRVLVTDTPGMTDGAVSYTVSAEGRKWMFCGDVISAPGQVWELHSLQKGFVGGARDYHGFLGARKMLLESLSRVDRAAPDTLIPSHGVPFAFASGAVDMVASRLNALWDNYAATSSLHHYSADEFNLDGDNSQCMKPAERMPFPEWVRKVAYTSFAVVSDSGAMLLIDCGIDKVTETLDEWKKNGGGEVEACWVTHYHDDHVNSLARVRERGIPILCDAVMAPIVENPVRYWLPCLAHEGSPVTHATADGEHWTWHEFSLTAFHFPGQTLYHGGLLVEGHGKKVLFAGDSFSPNGMDDYTAGNRVFLGRGQGMRRCFDIIRRVQPDYILNQHQGKAFVFSAQQLDYMETMLERREQMIGELTPWDNANFAVDAHWIRSYPYEQEIAPGAAFTVDVEFTNHADHAARAAAEAVLPAGWTALEQGPQGVDLSPRTSGYRGAAAPNPDGAVRLSAQCPADASPGLRVIPLRVWWGGRPLGQVVHALVRVNNAQKAPTVAQ